MNCFAQASTTCICSSRSDQSVGRNSIPQRCNLNRIEKMMSQGCLGNFFSILILFLDNQSPHQVIAKEKSFRLWCAPPSGNQSLNTSSRQRGVFSHPRASLMHAQTNLAMIHWNKMWSIVSGEPHKGQLMSPFQFLPFRTTPVGNLLCIACQTKTLSFIGSLLRHNFPTLLSSTPPKEMNLYIEREE